jgi:ABC-type branched-subunit amino acid transport system substrate-binding protein
MNREAKSLNTARNSRTEVIRVGVMQFPHINLGASDVLVKEATLMAIAEINQSGGILGKIIDPVVIDITSGDQSIAVQANSFLAEMEIHNLFGCGTSSIRKQIIPIITRD